MNVRLHIERLVVDDGVLARGDREGLAHAIELEVARRLAGPQLSAGACGRDAPAPAHVQAIGAGIVEHLPPGPGEPRRPRADAGPR